jgi:hypothetical protein
MPVIWKNGDMHGDLYSKLRKEYVQPRLSVWLNGKCLNKLCSRCNVKCVSGVKRVGI